MNRPGIAGDPSAWEEGATTPQEAHRPNLFRFSTFRTSGWFEKVTPGLPVRQRLGAVFG